MGRHSTAVAPAVTELSHSPSRKRKRDDNAPAEIEVDVNAPEPPSKKALRKAKKEARAVPPTVVVESTGTEVDVTENKTDPQPGNTDLAESIKAEPAPAKPAKQRSEHGIWIGNLPWTANKTDVRDFLTQNTDISPDVITRLHMPPPSKTTIASSMQKIKPQNKGFAYIDFSTAEALEAALALSEKLLSGRRVLIKDSKSFEGRPEKKEEEDGDAAAREGKAPSKRVFVGNLGFETTKEDLEEHFGRCGVVLDVHVATFEDSGKCKGYAWVTFEEMEGGKAAVRGWVDYHQDGEEDGEGSSEEEEDGDEEEGKGKKTETTKKKKKSKPRKWWVNRLNGRPLRMEFAEDKTVRYKKRYGKKAGANAENNDSTTATVGHQDSGPPHQAGEKPRSGHVGDGATRPLPPPPMKKRIDARTIKPGAALAAAPRLTGGIVEGRGKKILF